MTALLLRREVVPPLIRRTPTPTPTPVIGAGAVVALAMVFGWFSLFGDSDFEPYLEGVLARAGVGLQYALPVAAGAAAWASRQSRAVAQQFDDPAWVRAALVRWWAHLWPLFAGVGVGYALTIVISTNGTVVPGGVSFGVLAVYAATTLGSVSAGWVAGASLPSILAVPLAVFACFQWVALPLTAVTDLSWRYTAGYALYMCCDIVEETLDPNAVPGPIVLALALFGVSLLVARIPVRRLAVRAIIGLILAALWANTLAGSSNITAGQLRPAADQTCSAGFPRVCLYPETPVDERRAIANTLRDAYTRADTIDLRLPGTIRASTSDTLIDDPDVLTVGVLSDAGADQILASLATSIYSSQRCTPEATGAGAPVWDDTDLLIPYALAVVLGADNEAVLPVVELSDDGSWRGIGLPHTSQGESADFLEPLSFEAAREVVHAWRLDQAGCVA